MAEEFARSVLKVTLAQICQNLGWHAVHSSPIEILVDILDRYLKTIARTTHNVSEHYNRTQPNVDDLGLAFKELGISLTELEEYVNNVEPVPFAHAVPQFPVRQTSNRFDFPKEGSREVQQRPEWIHEHLPLMYPEAEEPPCVPSPLADPDAGKATTASDSSDQTGSPHGIRRPLEITQETSFSTPKRQRLNSDEEMRQLREVTSVMMTAAGIISPMTEGRLPDTCTPCKGFDSRPPTPAPMSPCTPAPSPSPPSPSTPPPSSLLLSVDVGLRPSETGKEKEGANGAKSSRKLPKEGKRVKKEINKEIKKKRELKAGGGEKKSRTKKFKLPGLKMTKRKDVTSKASAGGSKSSSSGRSPKASGSGRNKASPKGKPDKDSKMVVDVDEQPLDLSKAPPVKGKSAAKSPKGGAGAARSKAKNPKGEKKQVAGGQLASLLAKASGSKFDKGGDAASKMSSSSPHQTSLASPRDGSGRDRSDWQVDASVVADDSLQEQPAMMDVKLEGKAAVAAKMKSLDACISAVIKRGLHDGESGLGAGASSSSAPNRGENDNDYDGIPSIPSKVKLEPRDVYDFTDDDDDGGAGGDDGDEVEPGVERKTKNRIAVDDESIEIIIPPPPPPPPPPVPPSPLGKTTPVSKKSEDDKPSKSKDSKRAKGKNKNGSDKKSSKSKGKSRSKSSSASASAKQQQKQQFKDELLDELSDYDEMRPPKTPDYDDDDDDYDSGPSTTSSSRHHHHHHHHHHHPSLPFHSLSQIPSALLPFPLPAYPGPPPMGGMSLPTALPSTSVGVTSPRSQVPYPKLVDLAEVAISKAKHDGDFDVQQQQQQQLPATVTAKHKEKDKDKDSREKDKDKKKRDKREKDKEKAKSKKKKDKSREKASSDKGVEKGSGVGGGGGGAAGSEREKEKDRSKSSKKEKSAKLKSKDRKVEKNKEKDKDKEKKRDKLKDKADKKTKEKKPEKKKSKDKSAKKDKSDKPKEDPVARTASPSVSSSIPRLTFKLGSQSEGPKIVFKNVSVDSPPTRSPVPPSSSSKSKLKELVSPKQSPPREDTPSPPPPPPQPSPPPPPPPPPPPSSSSSSQVGSSSSSGKSHPKPQSKVHPVPAPARTVITETVGTIIDASGNKIWICPACTHPDDGSPMIGCDECDEWYHWVCVNIVVPPKEEEEWFCTRCIAKKQSSQKRKKHRRDK